MPRFALSGGALTVIVAIFGTTISPYMFFWQSAEEVEDLEAAHETDLLHSSPAKAKREKRRAKG